MPEGDWEKGRKLILTAFSILLPRRFEITVKAENEPIQVSTSE